MYMLWKHVPFPGLCCQYSQNRDRSTCGILSCLCWTNHLRDTGLWCWLHCVRMFLCIYQCMYVCISVCMRGHIRVRVRARVNMPWRWFMFSTFCVRENFAHTNTPSTLQAYAHTHTHTHTHTCTYTQTYTRLHPHTPTLSHLLAPCTPTCLLLLSFAMCWARVHVRMLAWDRM